jgi:hypothetical protein
LVGGWGEGKWVEERRKGWEEGWGKQQKEWQKERQKEGHKELRKEGQGPMVEQWQPMSDRAEAHKQD